MAKYLQSNDNIEIESVDDSLYLKLVHTKILNLVYPIGSIYLSTNPNSPSTYLGGTWERIKDKFLLSAGDSYSAGSTGGEATHVLTQNEMPSHYHTLWVKDFLGQTGGQTTPAYYFAINNNAITYNYASGVANSFDIAGTKSTGGGQAHNNMPPYLTVYVWKRTA